MRRFILILITCVAVSALSACVYRVNVAQGNLIKQEDLDQAEVGMTKTQIRFLLGTPMIDDPFTRDRWDYVYYLKLGRKDSEFKRWVSVYFVEDKVTEIRKELELSPDL